MKRIERVCNPWLLLVFFFVCGLFVYLRLLYPPRGGGYREKPNRNVLALGTDAFTRGPLTVTLNPPIELDYKTRDEVCRLRQDAVMMYPELLGGEYTPADSVFGRITDGAPWWGIEGQFYHCSGERSIDGVSEESRYILNPYLLVAAELMGFSIWQDAHLQWDDDRITDDDLRQPDFPYCCRPRLLRWWPAEARGEAVYDVSGYLRRVNRWTAAPLTIDHASFDLIAYNARDMNLNYLAIAYGESENISKEKPPECPTRNTQYIHLGGSCGYPGGCNNMSPWVPGISGVTINGLPARARILLWRERPRSVSSPPDMTFDIRFE